jgi:hypothetical protein
MVKMVYGISMVADVVNLRQQRKRKNRAAKAELAAQNRAKHGRPLAKRHHDEAEASRADRAHEGHFLGEKE